MPTTRCDHAQLLARTRAALETPDDIDATALSQLIEDIAAAEDLLQSHAILWPVDIHVAEIEHQYGINLHATFTHEAMMAEVAEFCREYWLEIHDSRDPKTLGDEEVTSIYFARHPNELLTTRHIVISPAGKHPPDDPACAA